VKLFVPYRRATLLVPSGPAHDPDQKHLFILLTDPAQVLDYECKHSLLVGVTTIHAGMPHDTACELHAGDHQFIKHKSFVFYAEARIEASQKLVDGVKRGVFSHQGMLAEDIFARVCHGPTVSRSTTPKVLAFYEAVAKAAREKE
jgi:hypothetical protein